MTWEELRTLSVRPKHHQYSEKAREQTRRAAAQCGTKATFSSRHDAKQAATSIATPNGDRRMSCYRCNLCGMIHLTSKESV